jgi:hypothetical protein
MMDATETVKGAWGWPPLSRKAHWFIDGRSLCGKWLYTGAPCRTQVTLAKIYPDDCAMCFKRVSALKAKASLNAAKATQP